MEKVDSGLLEKELVEIEKLLGEEKVLQLAKWGWTDITIKNKIFRLRCYRKIYSAPRESF